MKIVFICVGAIKKQYLREGFFEYINRIERYSPVEVLEIKKDTLSSGIKDAGRILDKLRKDDYVVVLDEKGSAFVSDRFARWLEAIFSRGKRRLCFVAGGPYGFHESVKERADLLLSLSPMTMPHDLARVVLAEQIYRAFTIMRGEPYSH